MQSPPSGISKSLTRNDGGPLETLAYDALSNRLDTVSAYTPRNKGTPPQTILRTLTYSASGNTAGDDDGLGTVLTNLYDSTDRLVEVRQGAAVLGAYTHNAAGQRVAKTAGGAVTHYIYDLGGNLIAEHDAATGNRQIEYGWLEGMLLGFFRSGFGLYAVTDHIGRPVMSVLWLNGSIQWEASYRPFGELHSQSGVARLNLRFPGQYFDAETGLHYNYFRDYDPSTGRYIQSDPIGLQGGWNTYAYVGGNPVMRVDRRGLFEGKKKGNWYSGCTDDDWKYCDNKCKKQGASGAKACAVQNWWAVAGVTKKGKPIPILRRRVDCECNYDDGSSVALLVGTGCLLAIICIIDPPACFLGLGAGALAASAS